MKKVFLFVLAQNIFLLVLVHPRFQGLGLSVILICSRSLVGDVILLRHQKKKSILGAIPEIVPGMALFSKRARKVARVIFDALKVTAVMMAALSRFDVDVNHAGRMTILMIIISALVTLRLSGS